MFFSTIRGTRENAFSIGDGSDSDKSFEANIPGASKPAVRFNHSTSKWQYSNDGTNFSDFGGGSGGFNFRQLWNKFNPIRYIRFNFSSVHGPDDGYVLVSSLWFMDVSGAKLNNESMVHTTGGSQVNGSPESCSNATPGFWQTISSALPNWWKVDLGILLVPATFEIKDYSGYSHRFMKDFTIDVSTDDTNWAQVLSGQTAANDTLQNFQLSMPSSPVVYYTNDSVHNGGYTYICKQGHTAADNNEPGVGANWNTYWYILATYIPPAGTPGVIPKFNITGDYIDDSVIQLVNHTRDAPDCWYFNLGLHGTPRTDWYYVDGKVISSNKNTLCFGRARAQEAIGLISNGYSGFNSGDYLEANGYWSEILVGPIEKYLHNEVFSVWGSDIGTAGSGVTIYPYFIIRQNGEFCFDMQNHFCTSHDFGGGYFGVFANGFSAIVIGPSTASYANDYVALVNGLCGVVNNPLYLAPAYLASGVPVAMLYVRNGEFHFATAPPGTATAIAPITDAMHVDTQNTTWLKSLIVSGRASFLKNYGLVYCPSFYPPAQSDTYVKATGEAGGQYKAYFTTDPSLSLTGDADCNQWAVGVAVEQRFHIDSGTPQILEKIYYENSHFSGTFTGLGVKNFTLWGSNDAGAFADLTYGDDTNWTQLQTDVAAFERHVDQDVVDPRYIFVNCAGVAYRYYAFKFADTYEPTPLAWMGMRRLELQAKW